ncbi:MAG: hypothetical protein ABMA64_22315 [Myxococcota bacterium]
MWWLFPLATASPPPACAPAPSPGWESTAAGLRLIGSALEITVPPDFVASGLAPGEDLFLLGASRPGTPREVLAVFVRPTCQKGVVAAVNTLSNAMSVAHLGEKPGVEPTFEQGSVAMGPVRGEFRSRTTGVVAHDRYPLWFRFVPAVDWGSFTVAFAASCPAPTDGDPPCSERVDALVSAARARATAE